MRSLGYGESLVILFFVLLAVVVAFYFKHQSDYESAPKDNFETAVPGSKFVYYVTHNKERKSEVKSKCLSKGEVYLETFQIMSNKLANRMDKKHTRQRATNAAVKKNSNMVLEYDVKYYTKKHGSKATKHWFESTYLIYDCKANNISFMK